MRQADKVRASTDLRILRELFDGNHPMRRDPRSLQGGFQLINRLPGCPFLDARLDGIFIPLSAFERLPGGTADSSQGRNSRPLLVRLHGDRDPTILVHCSKDPHNQGRRP